MGLKLASSPGYAFAIVALLAAIQGQAIARQWWLGFRPFAQAPQRVTFSWDMFAIPIERCDLAWEPPSAYLGHPLPRMHDMAAPIEWDPIYNRRVDYIAAGYAGCGERMAGQVLNGALFRVHCFVAHGEQTHDELACPAR